MMRKTPINFWLIEYVGSPSSAERIKYCEEAMPVVKNLMRGVGIDLTYSDLSMHFVPPPQKDVNPFWAPGIVREGAHGWLSKEDLVLHNHLFIPAIVANSHHFFGGAAGCIGCPNNDRVSVSVGDMVDTMLRPKPKALVRGIACCAAHEIAHVYGALHNDSAIRGMMSSHLNFFNDYALVDWPRSAKREIAEFLKGQK